MKPLLVRKCLIISIILIGSYFFSVSEGSISKNENQDTKESLSPGDYLCFIRCDLRIRSYRLHIPPCYTGENPVPVVFVLHGSGVRKVNSKTMKNYVDMDEKADEEGFIVVYPNGRRFRYGPYLNRPFVFFMDLFALFTNSKMWNCWDLNNVDDVEFIKNLIEHLESKLNVNSSRIYISGISGGGCMTHRLGAELSDKVAAIAPVAGSIGGVWFVSEPDDSKIYTIPEPTQSLPVIVLHGMNDEPVPYEGGWNFVFKIGLLEAWMYFISVNQSVSFWVEQNNCDKIPQINISESGRIIIRTYSNGCNNSEVVLVTYVDGRHEWFQTPRYEISATDLMWEFFEKHTKD